jgi:hypothetical protein
MSVGTWTVPFEFSPSVDSDTVSAIAGTRSWTGVERNANWIAGVVLVVIAPGALVVVRPPLAGVGSDGLGEDTGPGSGCS